LAFNRGDDMDAGAAICPNIAEVQAHPDAG